MMLRHYSEVLLVAGVGAESGQPALTVGRVQSAMRPRSDRSQISIVTVPRHGQLQTYMQAPVSVSGATL